MNCCNDFGECTQSLGCPARADHTQVLRLSSDRAAAVNTSTCWQKITADNKPLVGAKYLLINKDAGVAHVSVYRDDGWYTHFAGLPVFKDDAPIGGEV